MSASRDVTGPAATNIRGGERRGLARASADCDCKCDHCVCGSDLVVAVKVAFLQRNANPRMHEREAVGAFAAGNVLRNVPDSVATYFYCLRIFFPIIAPVVTNEPGVPLVDIIVIGVVVCVVGVIVVVGGVIARSQKDAIIVVRNGVTRERVVARIEQGDAVVVIV